jgi:hypothetical protein
MCGSNDCDIHSFPSQIIDALRFSSLLLEDRCIILIGDRRDELFPVLSLENDYVGGIHTVTLFIILVGRRASRHVPKLSGNGREDTIGKVNTSEME